MDDGGIGQSAWAAVMNHREAAITVLVADRVEIFRRGMIAVMQAAWPHWSYCAADTLGELRIRMAGENRTLVLLDLGLPGLGGVAEIPHIRALHPDCALLVVGDTEERSVILECLSAGALGYLLRKTSAVQLLRAVETILAGAVFAPACLAGRSCAVPAATQATAAEPPAFPHFTGRQKDVFQLLAEGCATKTIARRLGLSAGTVKVHLAAIYRRLGVHGRLEALARVRAFDTRETEFRGSAGHTAEARPHTSWLPEHSTAGMLHGYGARKCGASQAVSDCLRNDTQVFVESGLFPIGHPPRTNSEYS